MSDGIGWPGKVDGHPAPVLAEVEQGEHGLTVDLGGQVWTLPYLSALEAADLAGGVIRAAVGEQLLADLIACAHVGLEGAPEDAVGDPDAVFELLKRWEA